MLFHKQLMVALCGRLCRMRGSYFSFVGFVRPFIPLPNITHNRSHFKECFSLALAFLFDPKPVNCSKGNKTKRETVHLESHEAEARRSKEDSYLLLYIGSRQ